jgi:hypothetical protein
MVLDGGGGVIPSWMIDLTGQENGLRRIEDLYGSLKVRFDTLKDLWRIPRDTGICRECVEDFIGGFFAGSGSVYFVRRIGRFVG